MNAKNSKKHVFYSLLFVAMAAFAAAGACTFCLIEDNLVSYVLFGCLAACGLILLLCVLVFVCKKDKRALEDILVGLMIDVLLLLMTVFSPVIFILWICEKIHDAVSKKRYEQY